MAVAIKEAYEKFDLVAASILPIVDPLLTATVARYDIPGGSTHYPTGIKATIKYKTGELQNKRKLISEESRLTHLGVNICTKNIETNSIEVKVPTDVETLMKIADDKKIERIYKEKSK